MSRSQRGQTMVLLALLITALCGMLGLAIDGGRAFVDRRQIQNAADASAGAGAVTFLRSQSFTTAELAALDRYEVDRSLPVTTSGGSDPCSPAWSAPASGQSVTFTCTFPSDVSQGLTLTVKDSGPPAAYDEFIATGRHSLLTEIIQVIGSPNTVAISASGCAVTWDTSVCSAPGIGPQPNLLTIPPVVLATSAACGTGGDALSLSGGGTAGVVGNVVSYGDVTSGTAGVAGDVTYTCGSSPSTTLYCFPGGTATAPCPAGQAPSSTFQAGKPPPYSFPAAPASSTPQSTNGLAVNLTSGLYSAVSAGGGGAGGSGSINFGGSLGPYQSPCYFLAAGVYNFSGATNIAGGVWSNDLRPPDEPDQAANSIHTVIKSPQFWNMNGARCAGSFQVTGVTDLPTGSDPSPVPLPSGAYAFRMTSVRQDNGVTRESAASACKTLTLGTPSGLSVNVSNVPGAQAYNLYVSTPILSAATDDGDPAPGTCSSQDFYYIAQIPVQNYVTETNANLTGCPSTTSTPNCTLGVAANTTNPFDLCQIDQTEVDLHDLDDSKLPTGCPPPSAPPIPEPPAVSCSAASYTNVAAGTQGLAASFQVAASCNWPQAKYLVELLAPVGGTSLPDQDRAVGYETANWGLCAQTATLKVLPCPNNYDPVNNPYLTYVPGVDLTPGAVQLQADSTGCFNFQDAGNPGHGGLPFVFSGYQYSWTALIQGGTCTDNLYPAVGGEIIGHVSAPSATVDVTGTSPYMPYQGPQAPTVYGCVVGSQVAISNTAVGGTSTLAVYFVTPTKSLLISGYGIPVGSGC